MPYSKKGIYHFRTTTELGIDAMPLKRTLFVESTNTFYAKNTDAGLTPASTVQDAINNGNLINLTGTGGGGGVTSIDDLSDVDTDTTSPANGQVLKWNGSNWVPADDINTDSGGNLKSDGTIPMDAGYTPSNDQDIATKVSVQEEVITRLETNLAFDVGYFRGI